MSNWHQYLSSNEARFVDELTALVSIPSISALPEHAPDVERAAEWLADRLTGAGLEAVEVMPTGSLPVVYGQWLHAPGKPTILVYGHLDTQPVDPVDLWAHAPFEPVIQDDRIYGRGASDNKGNLMLPILAVEALLATEGALPINVKLLFEGEEESGSPKLAEFVSSHRELLSCDLVLNTDAGHTTEGIPELCIGLRGICGLQLDVSGPSSDLHSGSFGGAVQNPIHALVRLLDSMRSTEGRVLIDGFYDDVAVLSSEERAQIAAMPFDEQAYMDNLGIDALFGEPGFTPRERTWVRPTLEINGIWGGFQGAGSKTVLPSKAHAKITCRLVPFQDPEHVVKCILAHVEHHTPVGVTVKTGPLASGAKAYLMPCDQPGNQAAREVLIELFGIEPFYTRSGGSIPVCNLFLDELGAYSISLGFGLADEKAHAPNEFFRLSSYRQGQRAYAMMLEKLAE